MLHFWILISSSLVLSHCVEGVALRERDYAQWNAYPMEKFESNSKFIRGRFDGGVDKLRKSGMSFQAPFQESRLSTQMKQNGSNGIENVAIGFRRVDAKCNGLENLLSDIGVMSYILGLIGTMIGFFTMLISFVTQIQTVLSTYIVGVPSSFVALNTFFGDPSLITPSFANVVSFLGLIDTFVNLTFASPINGLVNVTDIFGAMFSFVSLYIGAASTFPDTVKYIMRALIGSDPAVYFATYGCPTNES